MSEVWPLLRPLCRRLALLGWASSAAGMAAGLAVAIASGTRLSPVMSTLQLVAGTSMAVSVVAFVTAAALQPRARIREKVKPGPVAPRGQDLLRVRPDAQRGPGDVRFGGQLIKAGGPASGIEHDMHANRSRLRRRLTRRSARTNRN